MGASHSNQSTTYTLKSDGNIVRVSGSADNFNNSPIVKVEQLQRGSLRSAVRKFFARCSFSPGWIRYEQILQNIAGFTQALFGPKPQLEFRLISPVLPLDMDVGETVKSYESRRYDVSASLRILEHGSSTSTTSASDMIRPDTDGVIWSTQLQDWRRFRSRIISWETRMRAVEEAEKYLQKNIQ